ncbi:MAG TPA: Gmad2 immunoglobulin-like domain-containing protein, partial [Anaerolineaceae bacterium]|nr:Gmad2 immunoglobulin-like domain-containing protein [Anaerolineaceae bacterium]
AFSGSEEHVITIDSPRDGDTISGSVRLIGSMPIGPFENTLLLRITDLSGGELLHEGFMVQTEDLGAPATFDNTVLIPGIAPGTRILLTLSELSMADGSPIALDSVLLVVGE